MWTVIVNVSLAPLARPLLVQVTVPDAFEQPVLDETKLVPAGRTSSSVWPALSDGPRFSTSRLNVSFVPAVAGSGDAVFVTFRSALRLTVTVTAPLSLPGVGSLVAVVAIAATFVSAPPSA